MGKSWKTRSHLNTGYPYNPIRAAHLQVLRPKVRGEDEENYFLGLYAEGHPVFSKAEIASQMPDLKRLEFLRAYSQYYSSKIASLYQCSRACLPPSALSGLNLIETQVTSLSTPLVTGLQHSSEKILWTLDAKVDAVVNAANTAIHPLAEPYNLKSMAISEDSLDGSRAYIHKLETTLQFVREHGVTGSAKHAFAALLKRLEETKVPHGSEQLILSNTVGEAWGRLSANPAVNRVLQQAQPSLDYTQRKYTDAHDMIVASALYHRAVGTAADVLQRVTETSLYKAAIDRLYPTISGFADPALERIAASSYTHAVIEHLKPARRMEEAPQCVSCESC